MVNGPKEDGSARSAQKARLGLRLAGRLGSWLRQKGRIGVWLRLGLDRTGWLGVTGRLSLFCFPPSPLSLAVMLGPHVSLSLSLPYMCVPQVRHSAGSCAASPRSGAAQLGCTPVWVVKGCVRVHAQGVRRKATLAWPRRERDVAAAFEW